MRRAYVCKKCDPAYRVFLSGAASVPKCPHHGKTMVQQANVPYKGKVTK